MHNTGTFHAASPFGGQYPFYRPNRNPVSIAPRTGPLFHLAGRRALLLADAENLIYSAENLGCGIFFDRLAAMLFHVCRECRLHAYLSTPPNQRDPRLVAFEGSGWTIHTNPIHEVRTRAGFRRRANADNFLLFSAGRLLSRHQVDAVVIGTGDGDLADDLARAVKDLDDNPQVFTLSLAGATSHRLNADHNPRIAGNIEVGRDCLYDRRRFCRAAGYD